MPLTIHSSHGHHATFHALPHLHPHHHVEWTADSIYVPSSSPLNTPADVYFDLPDHALTHSQLQRWCTRNGVSFLYHSSTGFAFHTTHFSRFRFEVDSDEDTDPSQPPPEDPSPMHEQPAVPASRPGRTPRRTRFSTKTLISELTEVPDVKPLEVSKHILYDPISNREFHQVNAARENLFAGSDERQRERENQITRDFEMTDIMQQHSRPSRPHDEMYEEPLSNPSEEPEGDAVDFDDEKYKLRNITLFRIPFFSTAKSIVNGKQNVSIDSGLSMGRITRASLVGGRRASLLPIKAASRFEVQVDSYYNISSPPVMAAALKSHCNAWFKLAEHDANVAIPSLKGLVGEHHSLPSALITCFMEDLGVCHNLGDVNAMHAHVALWLLDALYKTDDDEDDILLKRVAAWGKYAVETMEDQKYMPTGLGKALYALCLGDVDEAVDHALEDGNLHLAVLIGRALEAPKDALRADAEAQLAQYGFVDLKDADKDKWDSVLQPDDGVCAEERMIWLLLAGHAGPVARYLHLSWYHLFIMELLHGAGASALTQPERIAAAVNALWDSNISTKAPHRASKDVDVVCHLLCLYADPDGRYPLTTGVYANCSIGLQYRAMDCRFPWLLHQVLSAIIPQATTPRAAIMLSDALSSQLRAAGLQLWAFYVQCSGGAPDYALKAAIIRDWPEMANDEIDLGLREIMVEDGEEKVKENGTEYVEKDVKRIAGVLNAEEFLTQVLNVPRSWIFEAKAVAARANGNLLEECQCWIACGTDDGLRIAHDVLCQQVAADAISKRDAKAYPQIRSVLVHLQQSKRVSDWSSGGELLLMYFDHIVGVEGLSKVKLEVLRDMTSRLRRYSERARTSTQKYACTVIADGIATAQRALLLQASEMEHEEVLDALTDELERLQCSRGVSLRVAGEYRVEMSEGKVAARRYASAFVGYARHVKSEIAKT